VPPERYPADDAREWLNRARSNLAKAQSSEVHEIYLEDLCFDAQQAAEKRSRRFCSTWAHASHTRTILHLLTLVQRAGVSVPEDVRLAAALTEYAVATRYPGPAEPVSPREYREAVAMAAQVLDWARSIVGYTDKSDE